MWRQESDNALVVAAPETGAHAEAEGKYSQPPPFFSRRTQQKGVCVFHIRRAKKAAVKEEEIIINRAEQR
jgi:hypothetical protein